MQRRGSSRLSGSDVWEWGTALFPLSRSVVSEATRETIDFLRSKLSPNIQPQILSFPSGFEVQGWTVPDEWELRRAILSDPSGKIIADTAETNLRVWAHSRPFRGPVSLSELQSHIVTSSRLPDAIPYTTAYYTDTWGFSLRESERQALIDGSYFVDVDTHLKPGTLDVLELFLPGRSPAEILFTTYVCHPSLANNELSGPLTAVALANYLASIDEREYSYRFVLAPETIGHICYLSKRRDALKGRVWAAWNLTCVGDGGAWSFLPTPEGNLLPDRLSKRLLQDKTAAWREYPYAERGSDERQYTAPRVDLPMCSIMRSKYGEYPEYHTSFDDFTLVTAESLQETLDFFYSLIDVLESEGIYEAQQDFGEPFLSRVTDYPRVGARSGALDEGFYRDVWNFVAFARRSHLVDIAERLDWSLLRTAKAAHFCLAHDLVECRRH